MSPIWKVLDGAVPHGADEKKKYKNDDKSSWGGKAPPDPPIYLAGGAKHPQTPPRQAGGAKPPQTPPRKAGGAAPPQTPLLKILGRTNEHTTWKL